jgi:ACR3 family arsenite transporter
MNALVCGLDRRLGVARRTAGGAALIGAAAANLFAARSDAALTAAAVLIEMPVMLSVIHIVSRSKSWCEAGVSSVR